MTHDSRYSDAVSRERRHFVKHGDFMDDNGWTVYNRNCEHLILIISDTSDLF